MDLDNSTAPVKSEFIAVVLAGFGQELRPLTANHGEELCPKALLPIGNKPMLDYILSWLDNSGISDALVVCPTAHRRSIADHIHSDASVSFPSVRIDLQTYGDHQDSSFGTCSILRHFAHRIERDFIILPCDFIPPPSLPLSLIINKFRQESTLDDSICTCCWFETPSHVDKHDEWGPPPLSSSIIWDNETGTLVQVDVPDRLTRGEDEIEVRLSSLSVNPKSTLSNKLQDSSVYVCSHSMLELLHRKSGLESLRREFIPWLCKAGSQSLREGRYQSVLKPVIRSGSQKVSLQRSTLHYNRYINSHGSDDDSVKNSSRLRVGIITHKVANGFAARANNLYSYLELNRRFLEQLAQTVSACSTDVAIIDAKAQVSADSIVGHSTRIEERASIKKSVIGKHCIIGKMVKIVGSVILDHCVIGDGAKLDGCILGKNTKVGNTAELSRCVTQAGYEVDAAANHRNEKLDISDWTTGSVYKEDFDNDSDSSSSSSRESE